MAKIQLLEAKGIPGYIVSLVGTPTDLYVQIDWDYPGIASSFGWIPCHHCTETDGTIDCSHHKISELIDSARQYLDNHLGDIVEDPGYFR